MIPCGIPRKVAVDKPRPRRKDRECTTRTLRHRHQLPVDGGRVIDVASGSLLINVHPVNGGVLAEVIEVTVTEECRPCPRKDDDMSPFPRKVGSDPDETNAISSRTTDTRILVIESAPRLCANQWIERWILQPRRNPHQRILERHNELRVVVRVRSNNRWHIVDVQLPRRRSRCSRWVHRCWPLHIYCPLRVVGKRWQVFDPTRERVQNHVVRDIILLRMDCRFNLRCPRDYRLEVRWVRVIVARSAPRSRDCLVIGRILERVCCTGTPVCNDPSTGRVNDATIGQELHAGTRLDDERSGNDVIPTDAVERIADEYPHILCINASGNLTYRQLRKRSPRHHCNERCNRAQSKPTKHTTSERVKRCHTLIVH
ncbi:hypothetical protein HRbin20_01547 [bacterium HR20]|nr:hypothetical protein HRbin20_01547 [bacterium HR20]